MESKIDENLMKIRSGAGLGHLGSDFGVSGHPPAPILGEKVMHMMNKSQKSMQKNPQAKVVSKGNSSNDFFRGTRSHPTVPEHVPTQLVKKPAVPRLLSAADWAYAHLD